MTWRDLEQFDYERLLSDALDRVSNALDKREGSVAYDMIAPAMYELSYIIQLFVQAGKGTLLQNATGEVLDDFATRQGLTRYPATRAIVIIETKDLSGAPLDVPIGSKFMSVDQEKPIVYNVISIVKNGEFKAEAEVLGTDGNLYVGKVNPITTIPSLGSARITEIDTLASDEEEDIRLRARVTQNISKAPFGGNVSDYEETIGSMTGVAGVQVYPTWNGGGTVKVSVLGSNYLPLSQTALSRIQEDVDPTKDGQGIGTAPIGHTVTISTPTAVPININATITTSSGITIGQVRPQIEENLADYVQELRESWDKQDNMNNYSLTVFLSRVISEIMSVTGVTNVGDVTINGSGSDVTLTQNATTQQIPVMGTVAIS